MTTAVKICGLMNAAVLPVIQELKPEYVGFVFAPSRRQITAAEASSLVAQLPEETVPVGVFMNEPPAVVDAIGRQAGIRILQLHGNESPETCDWLRQAGWRVWKAFPLASPEEVQHCRQYRVDGYLMDAAGVGGAGGTGRCFPWEWLVGKTLPQPLILAGGLGTHNVEAALEQIAPAVVDVSSGVEVGGEKSPQQIRTFIRKVRRTHDE